MAEAIAIVALFIWIFIIQLKQVEISEVLNDIKNELKRKPEHEIETAAVQNRNNVSEEQDIAAKILRQNSEPSSINDIPDTEVFSKTILPSKMSEMSNSEKQEPSIEQFMIGNIFNKIGALAIFVGLIIFIKVIAPATAGWIKLVPGFTAGIVFIFAALRLQTNENMKSFSEVLLGTGFGTLFITTYCGSTVLGVLNVPSALTIATLILLAAFYTADRMKTVSMLAITIVASYLNPLFINPIFHVDHNFLFGYLTFVNLLGIIYTYRNKNRNTVNIINLILTFLYTAFTADNIIYPAILWIMYFAYDIIENSKEEKINNRLLNYTNLAIFTFFAMIILKDKIQLGAALLIPSLIYITTASAKVESEETFKHYLHLFLSSFALSVFFYTTNNPLWRVYIWSIETVVLAFFAEKYKQKDFANWAFGTSVAATVSALFIEDVIYATNIKDFNPVWNIRLSAMAPLILSGFLSSKITDRTNVDYFKNFSYIFKLEYLSLIYFYLGFEANDIINKMYIGQLPSSRKFIAYMKNAILGFAYTIQLKNLYNVTKSRLFELVSIGLGFGTLLYLFIYGCNYKPVTAFVPVFNIRFIAFLTAIAAAVMHAKGSGKDIFKYIAILLGFALLHIEVNDSIDRFNMSNAEYLLSICWILYAGIVTIIGIFKDKPYMKMSGIILCIFAIVRIFVYDLAHVDILYKFLAFLMLGTILLILSYFYNKKQK